MSAIEPNATTNASHWFNGSSHTGAVIPAAARGKSIGFCFMSTSQKVCADLQAVKPVR